MAKSERGKPTALVLRSRAAADDDGEAERLAEEALRHIERLERRAKLELVIEIGDYLVEHFFEGNLDLARSFSPVKAKALKRLEELAPTRDIAPSQLRIAVSMSAQYRALPAAVRDRLTVRQHRALLPVKDGQEKSKLARRALADKLSGPALSEIIRRAHGPAKTGPKPQGELERAINAARRALVSAMVENALEPAKVRALDPALRARLAREARTLRERIERISDALATTRG